MNVSSKDILTGPDTPLKRAVLASMRNDRASGDATHATAPVKPGRPRHTAGRMNRTEAAYASQLELRKVAGEVLWYGFECVKFRLADKTWFNPDFLVLMADGRFVVEEVKGHFEDDARIKIKVAAELFPVPFVAITKRKGGAGWQREEFKGKLRELPTTDPA